LHHTLGNDITMVTLSELGVICLKNENFHYEKAHEREILDVSGAGDTVIATASLCLAAGCNPEEMTWLSNLAGGLVCEKTGVVPIERARLLEEVEL
jgi:D-glycero-beta-D-manno-heptose-7-phosphate kinase